MIIEWFQAMFWKVMFIYGNHFYILNHTFFTCFHKAIHTEYRGNLWFFLFDEKLVQGFFVPCIFCFYLFLIFWLELPFHGRSIRNAALCVNGILRQHMTHGADDHMPLVKAMAIIVSANPWVFHLEKFLTGIGHKIAFRWQRIKRAIPLTYFKSFYEGLILWQYIEGAEKVFL